MALISLAEYARRLGKSPIDMRRRAREGKFRTARKIGRDWVIDENEPFVDLRVKSGRYIGVHPRTYKRAETRPGTRTTPADRRSGEDN